MPADPTTAPGRAAREALADTLASADPHDPTLCTGWDAAHLAAHVVLRETRPDVGLAALIGSRLSLAQGVVNRKLEATAYGQPWAELVEQVRRGPTLAPTRLRAVDDLVNTGEFAVHREDVRRARPDWAQRDAGIAPQVDDALWSALRTAGRLLARRVHGPLTARAGDRATVLRPGDGEPVTVVGEPLEIMLFLFGRDTVARVELTGPPDRVAEVRAAHRSA